MFFREQLLFYWAGLSRPVQSIALLFQAHIHIPNRVWCFLIVCFHYFIAPIKTSFERWWNYAETNAKKYSLQPNNHALLMLFILMLQSHYVTGRTWFISSYTASMFSDTHFGHFFTEFTLKSTRIECVIQFLPCCRKVLHPT